MLRRDAVGAAEGYLWDPYGRPADRRSPLDMRGFGRPQFDFLACPGEEPPSIECNEDADADFVDG